MLDQKTFNQWMDDFFQSKFNQLSYSNTRYPKRMEKVVIDLSVAPSQPVKVNVPFKSFLVSRVYSTATPTTDKAGTAKILFDYDNTMNVANALNIFVNDSAVMDSQVAVGYLTWTAQSDTTMEVYFFVDLDYRAGTTKTQIVGTVTTTPANTSPTSIKQVPSSRQVQQVASATSVAFTAIAVGFYGILRITAACSASSFDGRVDINGGTAIFRLGVTGSLALGEYRVLAGEVVNVTASSTAGYINAVLESYPI